MNNKHKFLVCLIGILFFIGSCRKETIEQMEEAPVLSGIESDYYVLVRESIVIRPALQNRIDSIEWILDGRKVASALQYTFQAPGNAGTHSLIVIAHNRGNIVQEVATITVGRYQHVTTMTNTILKVEASQKFANLTDVKWEVLNPPSELFRLSDNRTSSALFASVSLGTYQLKVSSGGLVDTILVTVRQPDKPYSPYIAKVFDYLPAPGQFVNELPKFNAGDTYETMITKVSNDLVGEQTNMITLGGWGGYVVVGFDHTIVNVAGRRDFRIEGNAFGAAANPRPNAPFGGSCEPGVVMVAYDKNKNGKPDEDEWYEIRGSASFSAQQEPWYSLAVAKGIDVRTFRGYEMTYHRPASEIATGGPQNHIAIPNYIRWTDNQGQDGYKIKNTFHAQTYYPGWISEDKITYKGIRLARNGVDESSGGSYYVLYGFRYGYVDNYPNAHDNSGIDIDWAIDKDGNRVTLPGIDFVKVYNGIDQENGWLGEASTEIGRGEDLHVAGKKIDTINP
ncbi:hypothetical protein LZZ85_12315 [Terrimonas sp. NA20]|uniref:Cell surface protein n=1 Tax=Terrimonas ginsenosidimutans TaxID=2908004 RepID=A0ABS9KRY7_9BACT|nr:hypothetical protein [Terrimonas ginsenosidimutans]MCG2615074.1 hypothetical protein [Terrimonas ginsenosidimutans]